MATAGIAVASFKAISKVVFSGFSASWAIATSNGLSIRFMGLLLLLTGRYPMIDTQPQRCVERIGPVLPNAYTIARTIGDSSCLTREQFTYTRTVLVIRIQVAIPGALR